MLSLLSTAWMFIALHAERPYQDLHIPEAITGDRFTLDLHKNRHSFWKGATTATYSYNHEPFWGPTLILNKGATVSIAVKNDLAEATTVHWHGLHLPASEDGGPHQIIPVGAEWTAHFKVSNNAATYWYHPHPHGSTQKQLTMGAGGLIIVRDSIESCLQLPRTYGVDDIPLVLTSRRFSRANEFTFAGDNDKYGDYSFANGTLDPQITLPKAWVRLRILNAEVERGYNLGFTDNRTFYLIATDGGLVDRPVPLKRLRLMVGERAEVLVNLQADALAGSVDLMSYNANQAFGFPGGEPGSYPPNGSYLNNRDFRVLHIKVGAASTNAVKSISDTLVANRLWAEADASVHRNLSINGGGPPDREFQFGGKYFDMDRVDQVVRLGAIECWHISNDQIFGHSFHIHDIQFSVVDRNGEAVPSEERGWKDTVYIPRNGSVKLVAKFDDYASDTYPFMYHCHMTNHEDGGLMGQFLVSADPTKLRATDNGEVSLRHEVAPNEVKRGSTLKGTIVALPTCRDEIGEPVSITTLAHQRPVVLLFLQADCPCSREAAIYLNRMVSRMGSKVAFIGALDAGPERARQWRKGIAGKFTILADPTLRIARLLRVKTSAGMVVLDGNGRLAGFYPGYSRSVFESLQTQLSNLSGQPVAKELFQDAPTQIRAGCAFARMEEN